MNAFATIRHRLDVTQSELAAALCVSQGNVSHYEQGRHAVPPKVARRLIEFAKSKGHEVTFEQVYADDAPPPAPPKRQRVRRVTAAAV